MDEDKHQSGKVVVYRPFSHYHTVHSGRGKVTVAPIHSLSWWAAAVLSHLFPPLTLLLSFVMGYPQGKEDTLAGITIIIMAITGLIAIVYYSTTFRITISDNGNKVVLTRYFYLVPVTWKHFDLNDGELNLGTRIYEYRLFYGQTEKGFIERVFGLLPAVFFSLISMGHNSELFGEKHETQVFTLRLSGKEGHFHLVSSRKRKTVKDILSAVAKVFPDKVTLPEPLAGDRSAR